MIERHRITSREQWLGLRASDLTASDVGAAAGVDPHKTTLKLYAEKTGLLMADGDNNLMRRGRWLEPAVIEALRDQHPDWQITQPRLYLRDTELRLGATPDAIAQTNEPGLTNIQCKVVSRPAYERDWQAGPPMAYVLQTLTEGLLLDAARSFVAALVLDTYSAELELHPVHRHSGAEARVQAIAAEFWGNVATGGRPAADYARDADTVAALFPQSVAEPVLDLTGDNRLPDLLVERGVLKAAVTDCDKRLSEIDVEIRDKLGAAEAATLPGWRISWKTHERAEYTVAASTYRALRITDLRDKDQAA